MSENDALPGRTVLLMVFALIFLFVSALSWKDVSTSVVLLAVGFVLAIMAAVAMMLS